MKKPVIYSAFVILIVAMAACSKTDDLQVQNSQEDDTSPPLKNVLIKTFKVLDDNGTFQFAFSPENDCFSQGYAQASIIGSGIATRMGTYTYEALFCVNEQGIPMSSMNSTLTTANGDKIFEIIEDPSVGFYFNPDDGLFHMDFAVTGGTGRFEGVTGTASYWGTVDFVNNVSHFEGMIVLNY